MAYPPLQSPPRRFRILSDLEKREIRLAFDAFDTKQKSAITCRQAKLAVRALGFQVQKSYILELLSTFSKGQDSDITFEDFQYLVEKVVQRRDPGESMLRSFQLFDKDGNGQIDLADLRAVTRQIGEEADDDTLQALITEFDVDGDGQSK
eukprot:jgi/Mesvir1/4170/Mv17191-RA.1